MPKLWVKYIKIITFIWHEWSLFGAYLDTYEWYTTCGTVLQLFPPIHTTLENAVMVTTLHQLFPTQTSSSFDVFCVPSMQPRVATTVIRKTLMSACFSSFGRHWCWPVFSTARARDHAGADMCMRSTPGCGTLAGPSLVTFGRQNRKDPQAFQVRNVLARLEDPAGPEACSRRGRFQLKWYDINKPVIYLSYINAQ